MALRIKVTIGALLAAVGALQAQNWQLPVRHQHWRDGGKGVLRITADGIAFDETGKGRQHSRTWKFSDVQQLTISASSLRVLTYEDQKWVGNRDREYIFDRLPEYNREQLAASMKARLGQRFITEFASPEAKPLWQLEVKLNRGRGGSQGTLLVGEDTIVFQTEQKRDSRTWTYDEIDNVSTSGEFELTFMVLERSGLSHSNTREFHFQLKAPLDENRYNALWRRVNASHGLQVLVQPVASQIFTGVITDSMCIVDHKLMRRSPDARCVQDCVQADKSTKYVLFDGQRAYRLSDQETPARYASQRVRIHGTLYKKTGVIKIDAIEPLQGSW